MEDLAEKGAVSIGTVIHNDCASSGHSARVASLLTSPSGKVALRIDSKANITDLLRLRADI